MYWEVLHEAMRMLPTIAMVRAVLGLQHAETHHLLQNSTPSNNTLEPHVNPLSNIGQLLLLPF